VLRDPLFHASVVLILVTSAVTAAVAFLLGEPQPPERLLNRIVVGLALSPFVYLCFLWLKEKRERGER